LPGPAGILGAGLWWRRYQPLAWNGQALPGEIDPCDQSQDQLIEILTIPLNLIKIADI
jgi:hypothetical protein